MFFGVTRLHHRLDLHHRPYRQPARARDGRDCGRCRNWCDPRSLSVLWSAPRRAALCGLGNAGADLRAPRRGQRLERGWRANGIPGLPLPTLFGSQLDPGVPLFLVAAAVLVITLAIAVFLRSSQLGLAMRAIRDDDERAEFLGYRRARIQVLVFTVCAALAAAAGSVYVLNEGFVSPTFLGVALSTQAIVYVILGGRGTLFGPLLGVLLLEVGGQRVQQSLQTEWPIVIGSVLLLVIVFLPGGLAELGVHLRDQLMVAARKTRNGVSRAGS